MKNSLKQKFFLALIIGLSVYPDRYLFCQSVPQNSFHSLELTQLTPVSPNAAALGKFGNTPVGLHTGIPQVSVPIYSINYKDLKLPVSLDFHLGGVKVEEIASWTGLSTALNAGGVITRTVRGIPDERVNLYSTGVTNLASGDIHDQQNQISGGLIDTEPDLYYFNVGGYSGKFFMDSDGKTFYPIPYQKLKIYPEAAYSRWIIITPDGTKYVFGTSRDNSRSAVETTTTNSFSLAPVTNIITPSNQGPITPTAWFLVEIISVNNNVINLFYTPESYSFHTNLSETDNQALMTDVLSASSCNCLPNLMIRARYNNYSKNDMIGQRLSQITFGKHKLVFNGDSCRYDLPGTKSLHNIQLFGDSISAPLKTFQFYYSYFKSIGTGYSPSQQCSAPAEEVAARYRLRLDSLVETGQIGTRKAPYAFYYDATPLPSRYTPYSPEAFAQDYWGFYNGAINNRNQDGLPTLIPALSEDINGNGTFQTIPGAVRTVDSNFAKAAILTQISYPTGGTTTFKFESNQADGIKGSAQNIGANKVFRDAAVSFEHNNTSLSNPLTTDTASTYFTIFSDEKLSSPTDSGAMVLVRKFDRAYLNNSVSGCKISDGCAIIGFQNMKTKQISMFSVIDSSSIYMHNGSYRMFVTYGGGKPIGSIYTLFLAHIMWSGIAIPDPNQPTTKNIGGMRIRQIADYDGINHKNDVTKTYSYLKFGSAVSSGLILTYPVYSYRYYTITYQYCELIDNLYLCKHFPVRYIVYSSNSNYPLLTTNGGPAGYSQVTVQEGSTGGKTEYTFTDANAFPDLNNLNFPFPPVCSFDWKRGLELKKKTYTQVGSLYTPVSEERKGYDFDLRGYFAHSTTGLKTGINGVDFQGQNTYVLPQSGRYLTATDYFSLSADTVISYDQANPALLTQKVTSYVIDTSSLLPRAIYSQNSEGDQLITSKTYPGNYTFPTVSGTAAYLGIKNLYASHILTAVVEQNEQRQQPGSSTVYTLGGTLTTYKFNRPLPDSVYMLENVVPIVNYTAATLSAAGFAKNALYVPNYSNLKYDTSGNILERSRVGGPHTAYIWDGWQENPIAEVKNAVSAQVAFTSFEYADPGNWKYQPSLAQRDNSARTGTYRFYMSAGNPIVSGALPAGTYIVSCWANFPPTANGTTMTSRDAVSNPVNFVFYQSQTTVAQGGTITIAGAGQLDELRLYPLGASVTDYSYFPLVGLAGTANPSGHLTTYEYDDLGRLQDIKDDHAQIKKLFRYHYAQKVFKSAMFSATFTGSCGIGSVSMINYTWPAGADSSYVSQQVADALASTHFLTNGQAYANTNTNCWIGTNSYCLTFPKIPPVKFNYSLSFSMQGTVIIGTFSRTAADTSYDGLIYAHSVYSGAPDYSFTQGLARGSASFVTRVPAPGNATPQNIIIDSVLNVTAGIPTGLRAFHSRIRPSDPNTILSNTLNGYSPYIAPLVDSICLPVFYNDSQSKVFTKNNCTSGTGTSTSYTVPAQKYTSYLSKTTANQLALNDIAANGQIWVNSAASGAQCLIHHDTTWQAADAQSCTKATPPSPVKPVLANYTIRDSIINASTVLVILTRNGSEPLTYQAGVTWQTSSPAYSGTDHIIFGNKRFNTTLPLGTTLPGNISGLSIINVVNDNIPVTTGYFPYASRIRLIDGVVDPSGYKEANTQNAGSHTYFPPSYSTATCPLNQP